ncbi:cytochrome C biogenesis protein CcdA [Rhodococcus pyridinivorans]|uniref:cytochrome c biogenesis CcdA family protein n=1 Tax=Rhodococcus TaxID=1827 RepID=UPI000DCABC20|nr:MULTISPECIES: cytochrome c biogenesis CcdA family protein [Rhodococcus]AWZ23946.1 cytochrome C biogenesis protein CcdA [Rhodococcus pyridinivorans]MDJ0398724.1 cytochrome c biogenesis CcdA family protein [Rhodococcus rhodochrous]UPK63015.1 cytochrome c biogenesis CcdA family protein [Rhodococcus pyridinivorans]
MTEIGLLGALLGGVLSLLSPCSALLLPSFFAYAFDGAGRLAARTALFYAGLTSVLAPLGAGLGLVGALLTQHRALITLVSGIVLIGLGIMTVLGAGFASKSAQRAANSLTGSGALSVFALGAVYGFAGFCSGPLLGSVLTIAVAGGHPLHGAVLMAVYSLGMALPLFALAVAWERFDLHKRTWLRGRPVTLGPLRTHTTSLISGLLFIGIGVLFLVTDGTANLTGLMGVDEQFDLQVALGQWATDMPGPGLLLTVAVIAFAVVAVRVIRQRRQDRPPHRIVAEADTGVDPDRPGYH